MSMLLKSINQSFLALSIICIWKKVFGIFIINPYNQHINIFTTENFGFHEPLLDKWNEIKKTQLHFELRRSQGSIT